MRRKMNYKNYNINNQKNIKFDLVDKKILQFDDMCLDFGIIDGEKIFLNDSRNMKLNYNKYIIMYDECNKIYMHGTQDIKKMI